MEIPKDQILDLLRQRGEGDKADQADRELPDNVDPERDRGILERLGSTRRTCSATWAGSAGSWACRPRC